MKPNLAVSSAKIKAQNPYARVKRRSLDGSMHYKKGRQEKIRPRPEADKISVSRSSPLFVSASRFRRSTLLPLCFAALGTVPAPMEAEITAQESHLPWRRPNCGGSLLRSTLLAKGAPPKKRQPVTTGRRVTVLSVRMQGVGRTGTLGNEPMRQRSVESVGPGSPFCPMGGDWVFLHFLETD